MNIEELLMAVKELSARKGLNEDIILEGLSDGLKKAFQKYVVPNSTIEVTMTFKPVKVIINQILNVVPDDISEDEFDDSIQIKFSQAREIYENCQIDEELKVQHNIKELSRLGMMQVNQILKQYLLEAEKNAIYKEFIPKKDKLLTGVVQNISQGMYITLELPDGLQAVLPEKNKLRNDNFKTGDFVKFYVKDIIQIDGDYKLLVTRKSNGFLEKLLEFEIPELQDNIIGIKVVSRIPGDKSKVAVDTDDLDIDPVALCIGSNGKRIKKIIDELGGEKIDIVRWNPDPIKFIKNIFASCKTYSINLNSSGTSAKIVVSDKDLPVAIGKHGSNVKLATWLTNIGLNIFSLSDAMEENIEILYNGNITDKNSEKTEKKSAFVIDFDTSAK